MVSENTEISLERSGFIWLKIESNGGTLYEPVFSIKSGVIS
jgi:hypothetical protein